MARLHCGPCERDQCRGVISPGSRSKHMGAIFADSAGAQATEDCKTNQGNEATPRHTGKSCGEPEQSAVLARLLLCPLRDAGTRALCWSDASQVLRGPKQQQRLHTCSLLPLHQPAGPVHGRI